MVYGWETLEIKVASIWRVGYVESLWLVVYCSGTLAARSTLVRPGL